MIYSLIPSVCVSLLLVGVVLRLFSRGAAPSSQLASLPADLAVALIVGGSIVAAGPVLGFLFPGSVRALVGSPLRLLVVESLRIIGGSLFAWALVRLLLRGLRSGAPRSLAATARLIAMGLLLFLTASGLYLTATVRWSSVWYVELVVPYLRSLLVFSPDVTVFASTPLLLRLHVLGAFVLVALWPFARWSAPLLALVRGLRDSAPITSEPTASR